MRTRIIFPLSLVALCALSNAEERKYPPLTKLILDKGRVVLGVVESDGEKEVVIKNLATLKLEKYRTSDIRSRKENVSDTDASISVSPAKLFAHRVLFSMPPSKIAGRIAAVNFNNVVINLGQDDGVAVADEFSVFRVLEEIKDPLSGKVIGENKRNISTIKVYEVDKNLSKAKMLGELETELKIGDSVALIREKAIAVLPIANQDGQLTGSGLSLCDELSAALTNSDISVVERAALLSAVEENLLQQTDFFDEKKTQQLGKLIGAYAIVTGSLSPSKAQAEAHLKLIEVSTGKILAAAKYRAKYSDDAAIDLSAIHSSPTTPSDDRGAAKNIPVKRLRKGKNVISQIDLGRDAFRPERQFKDRFSIQDGVLVSSSDPSRICFPVDVNTSQYQFEVSLKRVSGGDTFMFAIPVGDRRCCVGFSGKIDGSHGISLIDGTYSSDMKNPSRVIGTIPNNREVVLAISVKTDGKNASIKAQIDGETLVDWSGKESSLSDDGNWTPANRSRIAFGTTHNVIELRSLYISSK